MFGVWESGLLIIGEVIEMVFAVVVMSPWVVGTWFI